MITASEHQTSHQTDSKLEPTVDLQQRLNLVEVLVEILPKPPSREKRISN